MSTADDIKALAEVCKASSHQVLHEMNSMGRRPDSPPNAVLLWNQQHTRLDNQLDSLTASASNLAAIAASAELAEAKNTIAQLAQLSVDAEKEIAKIQKASQLLSFVAKVLDVATGVILVVRAVSAPSELLGIPTGLVF